MSFWTDQKIEDLVRLAGRGLTSKEIAHALQTTRGAVISKARREGVQLHHTFGNHNHVRSLGPSSYFKVFTVPDNAHPMVGMLFQEALDQQVSLAELGRRSGVMYRTIQGWRARNPHIHNLEACFNALGKTLVVKETAE